MSCKFAAVKPILRGDGLKGCEWCFIWTRSIVADLSDAHDHLAAGLVGLHQLVRCLDIFETKYAGRLRLISPAGCVVGDLLEWNIVERIIRGAEGERAGECAEMNAARHLEDGIK